MKWHRGPIIGRGSFATVSLASSPSSPPFAVKSAPLSDSHSLLTEQLILSTLNSPHIVPYKGFDITTENNLHFFNLFLEYAPSGTLLEAIHHHGGSLPLYMIQSYTKSILLGLNYLHNSGIAHCDIKPQNILVHTLGGAKISDFGCAKLVSDTTANKKIGGTPLFMAPEVARGEHQSFPADVWALGCTVVHLVTGKPPWSGFTDPASVLYEIGFSENVPQLPRFMSEEGKDFLSKCFIKDPLHRWSVGQLLEHAFISLQQHPNSPPISAGTEWSRNEVENSKLKEESPRSVLRQSTSEPSLESISDIWSDTNWANERIQKLGELNEQVPNWEWDESWVTVRSNEKRQDVGSGSVMEETGGRREAELGSISNKKRRPEKKWKWKKGICCSYQQCLLLFKILFTSSNQLILIQICSYFLHLNSPPH